MTKRVLIVFFCMLLTAACTKDETVKPAAEMIPDEKLQEMEENYNANVDAEGDEVVCDKEAVIGTRFKEVRCRTKTQANLERNEAKRFLERRKTIPTNDSN